MNGYEFPYSISKYIRGMKIYENNIGCSKARIYRVQDEKEEFYLKISDSDSESKREYDMIQWLQNQINVPSVISYCSHGGKDYLLMRKVDGHMSCSQESLESPEKLVQALADGLLRIQSVNIKDCPSKYNLECKLEVALSRVNEGKIDMDDWEEDTEFSSPDELYKYLINNKPKEDLVFSHGDYCLPNVFINDGKLTGLIDLGRAGICDKWQDIALCVRSINHNLGSEKWVDLLFQYLNLEPEYDKIKYYILLDELF